MVLTNNQTPSISGLINAPGGHIFYTLIFLQKNPNLGLNRKRRQQALLLIGIS